jgi:hypothetical protein
MSDPKKSGAGRPAGEVGSSRGPSDGHTWALLSCVLALVASISGFGATADDLFATGSCRITLVGPAR